MRPRCKRYVNQPGVIAVPRSGVLRDLTRSSGAGGGGSCHFRGKESLIHVRLGSNPEKLGNPTSCSPLNVPDCKQGRCPRFLDKMVFGFILKFCLVIVAAAT